MKVVLEWRVGWLDRAGRWRWRRPGAMGCQRLRRGWLRRRAAARVPPVGCGRQPPQANGSHCSFWLAVWLVQPRWRLSARRVPPGCARSNLPDKCREGAVVRLGVVRKTRSQPASFQRRSRAGLGVPCSRHAPLPTESKSVRRIRRQPIRPSILQSCDPPQNQRGNRLR